MLVQVLYEASLRHVLFNGKNGIVLKLMTNFNESLYFLQNAKITNLELIDVAQKSTAITFKLSSYREDWEYMGYVDAALESTAGNIFTGVNFELYCGIGFCAQHSAIAELVKN